MTESIARTCRVGLLLAVLAIAATAPAPAAAQGQPTATDRAAARAADRAATRKGDYIVAIVNQELVTAVEVERRMARTREEAARAGGRLPPEGEFQRHIVDALIEERVILTYSRETGAKVDDADVDRAVQTIGAQNQMTQDQLRARLRADGIEFPLFRANLRDQLLVERTREREVSQRIRVTDGDIDKLLEQQRKAASIELEINLAQILVTVPEGASDAVLAQRRARAEQALARVRAGEAFDLVAREISEDGNRERGGEIGLKPTSRLPDIFVEASRSMRRGEVAPALLRSGAGFHVLKVIDKTDPAAPRVTQTQVRHILLRVSAQLNAEQAQARLAGYRRLIDSGERKFEEMARQYSEDGSAAQGGDLGWASPGMMVPEFEEAMNRLPVGGLSQPVVSRFGVHLVQVLARRQVEIDPKQLREQARNTLREQKFEEAYVEWARELRARAYVEMREPPL